MYRKLSAPLDIQWEITPWCNHNCRHCYNYWRQEEVVKRILSEEELSCIRKTASEILSNKVFHATITGGEPLGVISQIFPILKDLHNSGVHFSINTNLTLLDDDNVSLLKALEIKSILTSLISSEEEINDYITQVDGSQQRTIKGIKKAKDNGFSVSVNMVALKSNIGTIRDTAQLVHSTGADAFCVTKASKPNNCNDFSEHALSSQELEKMFKELLQVHDKYGIRVASLEHYPLCMFPDSETLNAFGKRNCSAAKTSCTVGFNGEVRPCSHSPISYGNLCDFGFSTAWESMSDWREEKLVPEECRLCKAYPKDCSGGCRIEALNNFGHLDASDPYSKQCEPITNIKYKKIDLLPETTFVRAHPNLRFRKEEFGYIAYLSSTSWLAVDNKLHRLLVDGKSFSTKDVQKAYQSTISEACKTLSILSSRSLVELIK